MVGRDKQLDKEEDISASGLSPFKSSLYRTLWIAALFSYVGAAMYDVGASWLMTSLAPNPLYLRQHERVTKNVQVMEDSIRALLKDGPQPIITHYIGKSALK
jgi:Transmembrane secretion effector